nr:p39-SP24 virion membrane protein [Hibiscus green spot virus 2]
MVRGWNRVYCDCRVGDVGRYYFSHCEVHGFDGMEVLRRMVEQLLVCLCDVGCGDFVCELLCFCGPTTILLFWFSLFLFSTGRYLSLRQPLLFWVETTRCSCCCLMATQEIINMSGYGGMRMGRQNPFRSNGVFRRRVKNVVNNAGVARAKIKVKARGKGLDALIYDVFNICLKFIMKPHILIMYACLLVVVYNKGEAGDVIEKALKAYPQNPILKWAKTNYVRFIGILVGLPVIIDAPRSFQLLITGTVFVSTYILPPQTLTTYLLGFVSLHVYSKAKSVQLRIILLASFATYLVLSGIVDTEKFTGSGTVPSGAHGAPKLSEVPIPTVLNDPGPRIRSVEERLPVIKRGGPGGV